VVVGGMVRGEYAWVVCVCISYTGDGGQLGGSFLWSGRGGCFGLLTSQHTLLVIAVNPCILQYDLYRRLRLQFLVLVMMGAVTPETCRVTLQ